MFVVLLVALLFSTNYAAIEQQTITLTAIPKDEVETKKQKYVSEPIVTVLANPGDYVIYELDMTQYPEFNSTDGLQFNASATQPDMTTIDVELSFDDDVKDLTKFIDSATWQDALMTSDGADQDELQDCKVESKKYYLKLTSDSMNMGIVNVTWHASVETDTSDWICSNELLKALKKALGGLFIFAIVMAVLCGLCCLGVILAAVCGTGAVCCLVCCPKDNNDPKNPLLKEV